MTRIRIEELLVQLEFDRRLLDELRAAGLFESDELHFEEADELRVAAELMRSLGVNAPGVQVALQLRRRLIALEQRTANVLRELLEERKR
ncbi:MAG TPA: hypothetical protein VMW19_12455 [Myxococcota bacterium]|nr:hypothetical protein [Myxococcota bacterium]